MLTRTKLLMLCALLLLAAACSNVNKYLEEMIPYDATGVVSIDLPQILDRAGFNTDDGLVVPEQLQVVLDGNDASLLCQAINDLPAMGVSDDGRVYVFFTAKTFATVMLVPLDDEDKARQIVTRRTGDDFNNVADLDCIYREDYLYCIRDHVLFIGRVNKAVEAATAAKAAKQILSKVNRSIFDNEDVKACMNSDNAVNAFLELQGLRKLLNSNRTYREMADKFPLISIFTESDIKSVECHLVLNDHDADVTATINVDDNSEYLQLLNTTLSAPSANVLAAIPNSMDYVLSMSVNGAQFVELSQIQQLVTMFKNLPYLGRIDIVSILKTIDGPIAVGLARDVNFDDDWNAVVAALTTDPESVLTQISNFATAMGQAPEIVNGEYIYQYENKMINMGTIDGVLFIKMLNYEQTEGYANEMVVLDSLFAKSKIGAFIHPHDMAPSAQFVFGMPDPKTGHGIFKPDEKDANAALTLLRMLCSIKPLGTLEEDPNDYLGDVKLQPL